jgi:excisionase family DNA binding protein
LASHYPATQIATDWRAGGADLSPVDLPWPQTLETFLNTALDSAASVRAYQRQCTLACRSMGILSLAELNGEMLGRYRAEVMGKAKLGPASKAQALDTLRSFLKWAGMHGAHRLDDRVINYCLRSPKSTVLRPHKPLKGDEVPRFWETVATGRPIEYAVACLCLGAGLRASELEGLRIEDCYEDLEGAPAIRVYQGKGSKDRIVPMQPRYFDGVTAYLRATGRDLTSSGRVLVAEDNASRSRVGAPGIATGGIRALIKRVLDKAGIDPRQRGPHAFRHQYAMEVWRAGGGPVIVQKLLGHASIVTTMRYLDHLELGDIRAALPQSGPGAPPREPAGVTLGTDEAAAVLGLSPRHVLYLWHHGKLTATKVGTAIRFEPITVEALRADRVSERG